jgi:heat shock protein HslJ
MNKKLMAILTLLVFSGLILSACAEHGSSPSLAGSSWKLVSYGAAQNQTAATAGIQTNLDFGTDGNVNGNMGCNTFGGKYEVNNGAILFSQIASTLKACPEPQMTQEGTAFQVMDGSVRFEVEGDTLTIHAADSANAIKLSRMQSK